MTDPNWLPLEATPPYSDHTSGYNCVAGSLLNAGRAFFGVNRMELSRARIAPNVPSVTRNYHRFTDVADTMDARVLQGIHFRSADVQGARLGRHVAEWVNDNFLRPVD